MHDELNPPEETPEEATHRAAREAREKLEEIEASFKGRMQKLEDRAKESRNKREAEKREKLKELKQSGEDARGLGIGMQIAYTILGLPLVGFVVGMLIDRSTHSTVWQNALGLGGTFLGVGAALVLLNRENKRNP
ncbi:MAG: hypothetical protein JNM85_09925 [Chthonomonas sp.]|nr:hypothetical protein [Chthonomonas sp.]